MKDARNKLLLAGLVFVVGLQVGAAEGKISLGISIGSGRCYSHYRHYPSYYHHRYYSPFGPRYTWHDYGHYWPSYRYYRRPHYSSGVSIYVDDVQSVIDSIRGKDSRAKAKKVKNPNAPNEDYWAASGKSNEELFTEIRLKKADLLELIKSPEKELRAKAVEGLVGFCFDKEVRAAMEDVLLSDPEVELRRQAAKALGRVSNKEVLSALQAAKAGDPDHGVRQEAYKSIILVKGY